MRRFLIALAVALGVVAALVAALPWLAEPALRIGLRLATPDGVDFARLRFAWGDLELDDVEVGKAGQELGRLRVIYRLPDLLAGRLERVELDGLVLRAAWRDGRLQLAGLQTGGTGGPLPVPEIGQAVLRDARVQLSTGLGTFELPLSAEIRTIGETLAFAGSIQDARLAGSGALSASGSFEGELPRAAPLALDQARASGSIAVAAEQAGLGPAQGIDGRATMEFDLADGRLQLATSVVDGAWQGGSLGEARLQLAAEVGAQAARGTLDLALSDVSFAAPELALRGGSLGWSALDWSYVGDRLSLQAGAPGALALESLAAADLRAGPLRLRLEPAEQPLLELALAEGRPAAWRQHAAAVIEALEVDLPAPLRLQSDAGVITLAAEGTGQRLEHADIRLADGALRLPAHALALDGIAAAASLGAAGLAPGQAVPVTVARISHGGRPAWFAPLALQAEVTPVGQSFNVAATLRRIGGGLALELRGSSTATGDGRATLRLAPVAFGPDLQPGDLAPIAAGLVRDVSGKLALDGTLRWSGAGIGGDLAILLDQVGLTSGPARLAQLNGVVRLDSVWPPTTPPGQQLAIGLLDLGLPLTAGIASFQLAAGPRLEVEQLEWRLAGGMARAEPFSVGSRLEDLNVILRAEQLDLGPLLALTRMEGLSGEGSLDGVLPLRFAQGAAIIDGGELAATRPGVLRYAAASAPAALRSAGEGVDLLLQALENFHYEVLRLTLDGRTDAAMDIGLHLAGANPDLYGGHPVEFNLDLEGELANILRQGVASYQIPERIRERMQGFGR
ncbi:MAG TPA: YdbH domain-containing protein [Geminicoccaceae bacterium]|nr:YdbH domain-containing protein [Geminicoccaceae bacterium]